MRRTATVLILSTALLGAVVLGRGDGAGSRPPGSGTVVGDGILAAGTGLTAAADCDQLLSHLQREAVARMTPWGLPGTGHGWMAMEGDVAMDSAAGAEAAPSDGARSAPTGDGGDTTNTQEAGVDEPDLVETDGTHLYVGTAGALRVLDVSGATPREVGRLAFPDAGDLPMMRVGDRLAVFTPRWSDRPLPGQPVPLSDEAGGAAVESGEEVAADRIAPGMPWWGGTEVTRVTLVDVSDATRPEVVETLDVDGRLVSARAVDGVVRLALSTPPIALVFPPPTEGGLRGEQDALERNRELVRDTTIEDWLPWSVRTDAAGRSTEGPALDCTVVHAPAAFSGFGTLSVLALDLADDDLVADGQAGVLASGETMYASTGTVTVATSEWVDPESFRSEADARVAAEEFRTALHTFETPGVAVRYRASGTVPGTVLNQFSMSEHEGVLRVATTEGAPWWGGGETSRSTVTTLQARGSELVPLGEVTDLGEGERIYAVRFLGDVGYVVTFRQVDPLYTLDLSDPRDPRVVGELKIAGYSAYLHPLPDGRLLGVGQDADERTGRTEGTKLSLFDVSDLAAPAELDSAKLEDASSEAEWDHHAFLYADGLTVLPVERYAWDERTGVESWSVGAVAFRVEGDRIVSRTWLPGAEASGGDLASGRVADPWLHRVRRALVLDGRLLTIADAEVVVRDADTLDELARIRLDG